MKPSLFARLGWPLLLGILMAGCSGNLRGGGGLTVLPPTATLPAPAIRQTTRLPTSVPTSSPTQTPIPSPTGTRDPYHHLTVEYLSERAYGGGQLTFHETLGQYDRFTRYLVSYPSDGLEIYGFLNLPHGGGPFPAIIALHGYIDPAIYQTLDYTTRYADALAQSGYAVFHPNLRGYAPSDSGPNEFRVGMALDVLNLIAIIRDTARQPGPLEVVDPDRLGLWGHSMGGGISLRVLTVSQEVQAAVLYGSMSGNEAWNFEKILEWSQGARGEFELSFPDQVLRRISPINHLDRIRASVAIHHGDADELVPLAWSDDLCQRLKELEVQVDCYTYPGQPHTFYGDADLLFIQRTVAYFGEALKP